MELWTHPDGTINNDFRPTIDQAQRKFAPWTLHPGKNIYDIHDSRVYTPCAGFTNTLIRQTNLHGLIPVNAISLPQVIKKPVPRAQYIDVRWL